MKHFWNFIFLLSLFGCGSDRYANAPAGEFSGSVVVVWVGENETPYGDGRFVYVPTASPLIFTRKPNPGQNVTLTTIKPEMMYTDGGSIPRLAQVFKGFSPWGYAPAYIVHDWLYVARRCVNDNIAEGAQHGVENMDFLESADIAAEAIHGLIAQHRVKKDDVAPAVITAAVGSSISESLWNHRGQCEGEKVTQKDRDEIIRAFPDLFTSSERRFVRAGPKARVVAILSFDK